MHYVLHLAPMKTLQLELTADSNWLCIVVCSSDVCSCSLKAIFLVSVILNTCTSISFEKQKIVQCDFTTRTCTAYFTFVWYICYTHNDWYLPALADSSSNNIQVQASPTTNNLSTGFGQHTCNMTKPVLFYVSQLSKIDSKKMSVFSSVDLWPDLWPLLTDVRLLLRYEVSAAGCLARCGDIHITDSIHMLLHVWNQQRLQRVCSGSQS